MCLNPETVFLTAPTLLLLSCVGTSGLFNFDLRRHPWSTVLPLWIQWIVSVQTRTKWITVFTPRPIKGLKAKWVLCLYLFGCARVSQVGVPQDCPSRGDRTELLGGRLGATTCFQTVVGSSAAFGPVFYFCSGQAGGKVSGWWGWMDALLSPPTHLCLKLGSWLQGSYKIFEVLLDNFFWLKLQGRVFKCYSVLLQSMYLLMFWIQELCNHFANRLCLVTITIKCNPKPLVMAFYASCFIIFIISELYNLYILVWVMLAVCFFLPQDSN